MDKIKAMTGKKLFLFVFLIIITGCAAIVYKTVDYESLYGPSAPKQRVMTPEQAKLYQQEHIDMIRFARTEIDIEKLYSKFGIRRTNPEIWENADWFNEQHKKYRGLNAGLLDMSRYDNL